MGYASNREPRRRWNRHEHRARGVPCVSCGAPARLHSADLAFCTECLDWARQQNLAEWDDLGTGD